MEDIKIEVSEIDKYIRHSYVFNVFEDLKIDISDCKTLEQAHLRILNVFKLHKDVVYCDWNKTYYPSKMVAIDLIKNDERFSGALFGGEIKLEHRPYCQNLNNGFMKDLSESQTIQIEGFLQFIRQKLKE